MKKKLLIFLFLLFILVGCSKTTNTPKGEVQKLFSNYMNLSSDVLIQLDNVIGNEDLTDDEKDIVRRGRNANNHHLPKNSNVQEYMYSTAFEGLIGYLYLCKKYDRVKEIIEKYIL